MAKMIIADYYIDELRELADKMKSAKADGDKAFEESKLPNIMRVAHMSGYLQICLKEYYNELNKIIKSLE